MSIKVYAQSVCYLFHVEKITINIWYYIKLLLVKLSYKKKLNLF